MNVYVVIKEIGNSYDYDHIVSRVFDDEKAANDYVDAQDYPVKYDVEEHELQSEIHLRGDKMKLIIEIYLDTKDWKPTTAQVQTILRRTTNRLKQKLPCLGLTQDIVNDEETIIGKWGIYEN